MCCIVWMTMLSSTYFLQTVGGLGDVLMILTSKSSMNRLATNGAYR